MARTVTPAVRRAQQKRADLLDRHLEDIKTCPCPSGSAETRRLIDEAVVNGKVKRIEGGRKRKPDMRRRGREY